MARVPGFTAGANTSASTTIANRIDVSTITRAPDDTTGTIAALATMSRGDRLESRSDLAA